MTHFGFLLLQRVITLFIFRESKINYYVFVYLQIIRFSTMAIAMKNPFPKLKSYRWSYLLSKYEALSLEEIVLIRKIFTASGNYSSVCIFTDPWFPRHDQFRSHCSWWTDIWFLGKRGQRFVGKCNDKLWKSERFGNTFLNRYEFEIIGYWMNSNSSRFTSNTRTSKELQILLRNLNDRAFDKYKLF